MKKFLLAAALLCAGTFAPQTEVFGSTTQNLVTLKGGPDVGVMEGWVFCSVSSGIIEQIDIYNAQKTLVASSACFDDECSVNVSFLPSGLYYVKVQTSKFGTYFAPITLVSPK